MISRGMAWRYRKADEVASALAQEPEKWFSLCSLRFEIFCQVLFLYIVTSFLSRVIIGVRISESESTFTRVYTFRSLLAVPYVSPH